MKKPKSKYRIKKIVEGDEQYFIIEHKVLWFWIEYCEFPLDDTLKFHDEWMAEKYIYKLTYQKEKIVKEYDKYGNEIEKDIEYRIR